jgi:hypothetical protein
MMAALEGSRMTAAAELNAQDSARLRGLTRAQALVLMLVLSTLAAGLIWAGASTLVIIERSIALAFVAVIGPLPSPSPCGPSVRPRR